MCVEEAHGILGLGLEGATGGYVAYDHNKTPKNIEKADVAVEGADVKIKMDVWRYELGTGDGDRECECAEWWVGRGDCASGRQDRDGISYQHKNEGNFQYWATEMKFVGFMPLIYNDEADQQDIDNVF